MRGASWYDELKDMWSEEYVIMIDMCWHYFIENYVQAFQIQRHVELSTDGKYIIHLKQTLKMPHTYQQLITILKLGSTHQRDIC